ncbi:MAG: glutamate-cysteine ligase family protein [bacterium]
MNEPDSRRIGYEDLVRYFHEGSKPSGCLRIGGEYELFGVHARTGVAVPYEGEGGIQSILNRLLKNPRWAPLCEKEHLICLLGKDSSNVTLEPGAQIELSGAPRSTLLELSEELKEYIRELHSVSGDLGIDFIGIGMHPVSRQEEIPFVAKCRYDIMAPYLKEKGLLSHHMMKETATVQVNLDYTDEADAMDKLRTAMGITSMVSAMFANSPLSGGRANGFMTRREYVWMHTDPDRCGLLSFALREDARFEDYLRYALKVPMMFVVREGKWVPMNGISFGDFLERGALGLQAIMEDWRLHLSTLFPEVRLKQYIEVRGVDAQSPGMVLSVPALWKGILYDPEARRATWDMVRGWSFDERLKLHEEICRLGLRARIRGKIILGMAQELVRIAKQGLRRQGEDLRFMDPLEELILEKEQTPAEVLLEKWESWNHDVQKLIRNCSYFHESGWIP